MQFDLEFPDSLDVEPFILSQFAPVAIDWEGVTVKPRLSLKSGVAGFLPSLHSAKKGLKRLVYPAQYILATVVTGCPEAAWPAGSR
jgi:hypothetical protein